MRRALLLLVLLVLLPAPARAAGTSAVLVVGAPGLRWDDVTARTPALAQLAATGSTGALSARSAGPRTCPADGWVMAGAGNRARADAVDPDCSSTPPGRAALAAVVRDNAGLRYDSEVGALAQAVERTGACVAALGGPGAELMTGQPRTAGPPAAALDRCPLVVLDAGAVHHDGRRAADLARVDAAVAGAGAAARERGALLLLAGLADVADTDGAGPVPRLHVAVAAGPGHAGGGLVSASTRRAPYVQVVDLAPTVLRALGLPQPDVMTGQPWVRTADRTSRAGLLDLDRHAGRMRVFTPVFFALLVVAQVLLYGGALLLWRRADRAPPPRRVRRLVAGAALVCAAAPVATFLADLLPWWRADPALPALLGAVALADGLVVALALVGPWRRRLLGPVGLVCTVTAVVLAADLLTGARLQMSSLAGYSPLVAGRFAGVGNVAFAVLAAAALLATACWADGRGRRTCLAGCALAGCATVVVDGAPPFGSDVGGVLALVPGFALLAMLLAGVRVSLLRLATVGAAGVGVVVALGLYDHSRPPDAQTHLGRFVGQVLSGDAATVLERKAAANLSLLTHSVLTLLVPLLVLLAAQVLLRPPRPLAASFRHAPAWRSGLVAVLGMSLVGFAVNDSGVSVPALALAVAVPATVAVALRASGRPPVDEAGDGAARQVGTAAPPG